MSLRKTAILPFQCTRGAAAVVAGERHDVPAGRELDLEHLAVLVAEGDLAGREVELPHPAEPLVVERPDLVPVAPEAVAPAPERLRVVEAQHLDVGDPKA